MRQKIVLLMFVCFLLGGIIFTAFSSASAACRDDCYSDCCGSDSLCQGQDEVKCLTNCLKGCGGDNVSDVPAPQPADADDNKDNENKV